MKNSKRDVPKNSNFIGFYTLVEKEVARFLSVHLQTIFAPVITTFLFYLVFATVFSDYSREALGVPYMVFLAPGLIMMSMAQNAFANTSSSIIVGKMQGSLNDVLMAPLSAFELLAGFVIGGVIRGVFIGVLSIAVLWFFVDMRLEQPIWIVIFSVLGCSLLSTLGVLAGLWAEKFDHLALVSNFVITPLTYLSGTFYSVERLGEFWAHLAHYNPIFCMIDGFRFGFIGKNDISPLYEVGVLVGSNIFILFLAYLILKSGYKIKN